MSGINTNLNPAQSLTSIGNRGISPFSAGVTPTPPEVRTYATWNPADKQSGIVLSNGNLTFNTGSDNSFGGVRSTISKSSGKWYWEITIDNLSSGWNLYLGIANGTVNLASNPINNGFTNYRGNGEIYTNGVSAIGGSPYSNGTILGFALDADTGTISFYNNGVLQNSITGLVGDIFACPMSYNSSSTTNTNTANFGATPFAYPVPSGYNQGLYDTVDLTAGLVAHYPLATNSLDTSGNGYDGVGTAITYSSGSAVFNGTSSNITIPSNTDFDFGAEYFISTWINMPALPTSGNLFTLFYRLLSPGFGPQFELVLFNDSGTQKIFVSQATTFNPINYSLPTNQFVNLCVGYTAGVITFYLNSVAIGSVAQAVQCGAATNSMVIGFNADILSRYFNGSMKLSRIYNRFLNAGERAALYAEG